MKPRADSWAQSAHTEVKCVECHEKPLPWYAVPQRIAARSALLGRDVYKHLTGDYRDPVDGRPVGQSPMTDDHCLQCHDPNRKATSGFRILIDHAEHAKRNGSCISCHVRVGHPIATRGNPLSLMGQCFTCHGTGPKAKAPANCTLCHPSDYELKPASHKDAKWQRTHGKVALTDRKQCTMCHEQSFCNDCHGVKMPHPDGWEKGPTGHAVVAETNRQVCNQCHGARPDMCTMCHHEAYQPTQGTWVQQHYQQVQQKGAEYCVECHAPVFCVQCHVKASMEWPQDGS